MSPEGASPRFEPCSLLVIRPEISRQERGCFALGFAQWPCHTLRFAGALDPVFRLLAPPALVCRIASAG
jgi:hypothetical protein